MKKLLSFAALGSLLAAFLLAAVPARAQGVDSRINALEGELAQLKAEQARVRDGQMELRKEVTAAKAKLPNFRYRKGRGLTITAADKSWMWNMNYRLNMHMYFFPSAKVARGINAEEQEELASLNTAHETINEDGALDAVNVALEEQSEEAEEGINEKKGTDRASGRMQPRRNRLYMNFCWTDCFYEINLSLDGENSVRTAQFRDTRFKVHFEQYSPYLPTLHFGVRAGTKIYMGRSSSSGFKAEHNFACRAATTCTGSGSQIGLQWEDVPLGSLPGTLDFHAQYAGIAVGESHDFNRATDRKGFSTWVGLRPFRRTKSKYLKNLRLGFGYHMNNIDKRAARAANDDNADSEPNEIRLRTHEDRGRVTLFRARDIAGGNMQFFSPGIRHQIGPWFFRAMWARVTFEDKGNLAGDDTFDDEDNKGVRITGWEVTNGLWLWSPKGFLTGSSRRPGSVQLGWTFERADAKCGTGRRTSSGRGCIEGGNSDGGDKNQMHLLNRELTLWYNLHARTRIGLIWNWWKSSSTPVDTQVAIGCKARSNTVTANRGSESGEGPGRDCDWHTVTLAFQTRW